MKKRFLTKNLYKDYSHKGGKSYGIAGFGMGGKCTFWKRKNEKRRKTSEAFFRAIFSRVKICKFSFSYYKTKENRNDCAVLQMYTFFGRCTFVMRISWVGCLMYWSEAVRSVPGATSEARRERTTVYRSEQAVIGLSPMLIF